MTRRKPRPLPVFTPGWFSEPAYAWTQLQFKPQIVVDPRTGKFETDFARQQRHRMNSGWDLHTLGLAGALTGGAR